MSNIKEQPKKYSIEVRQRETQQDVNIMKTDKFLEALAEYNSLKSVMETLLHACSYDILVLYVWNDVCSGEYVPVVMACVETFVKEF